MYRVNKQLALFFNQVGVRSYHEKSITFLIASYFVTIIQIDIAAILFYYGQISKTLFYISNYLQVVIYPVVFLTVTVAFYFFADFGFEKRRDY